MTDQTPQVVPHRQRLRTGQVLLALVLLVLAAGPQLFFTTGYALDIARLALYMAVLAASWSFLSGIAGQFSFAHVAIAGLGGYAGAIWSARLADAGWIAGWGPSIVVGTAFGAVVGALLGLLLQRLAGAYLALFTIAFAEVARLVVVAEIDLTGGRLSLPVRPGLPGTEVAHYYVMLGLLVATLVVVYAVIRSRVGLNLRAMREDATAATAMGVNVGAHKLFALALAAALAALAGSMYFHTTDRMAPENLDLILMSQVIAYAVIGGLESPLAASLAAVVASLVLENLRQVRLDANEILVLAFAIIAIPLAVAATLMWRAVQRHRWRPLLRTGLAGLPWAVPGFGAFAWWLHAPPGAFGGAGVATGWLTLIAAGVLVVAAASAIGRRDPAARRAWTAVLVAIGALLLGGRLYLFLGIDTELGVWRLAVFGGLLALTLRFAPNGLLTPVLGYFAGSDRLRRLAVAHRDDTPESTVDNPAEEVRP